MRHKKVDPGSRRQQLAVLTRASVLVVAVSSAACSNERASGPTDGGTHGGATGSGGSADSPGESIGNGGSETAVATGSGGHGDSPGGSIGSGGSETAVATGSGGRADSSGGSSGSGGSEAAVATGAAGSTVFDDSRTLGDLTRAEAAQLCNDAYDFLETAVTRANLCKAAGLTYAITSGAPTDAGMQENCATREAEGASAPPYVPDCGELPSPCTATVAEYATCVADHAAAYNETVNALADCTEVASADKAAIWDFVSALPESCTSLTPACSGLDSPTPRVGPTGSIPTIDKTAEGIAESVEPLVPYSRVEGETMAWGSGIEVEDCSDGGRNVASIENGDYIKVESVDFLTGATSFEASVATEGNGGTIELHLDGVDGALLGTCAVSGSGGWQQWQVVSCDVGTVTDVHDLYLVFTGGSGSLFNLDWWRFTPQEPIVGTGGSGGMAGAAGDASTGGVPPTGGVSGSGTTAGGVPAVGGTSSHTGGVPPATGGTSDAGTAAAGAFASGGSSRSSGGAAHAAAGVGGSGPTQAGGAPAIGGRSAETGGATPTTGGTSGVSTPLTGGVPATGGRSSDTGVAPVLGGAVGASAPGPATSSGGLSTAGEPVTDSSAANAGESGCGCSTAGGTPQRPWASGALAALMALAGLRRQRSAHSGLSRIPRCAKQWPRDRVLALRRWAMHLRHGGRGLWSQSERSMFDEV